MSRLRRAAAVAVAIASIGSAGALAAGCGDSEEANDYVDELNELQFAYVDDVTELVSGSPPSTLNAVADYANELAALTQGLADDFAAVDAPDDVADLHAQLVTTLEDTSDQITAAGETIASGNEQQAAQAATEMQTATSQAQTQLQSTIDQINSTLQD